jgi:hypothetical protein
VLLVSVEWPKRAPTSSPSLLHPGTAPRSALRPPGIAAETDVTPAAPLIRDPQRWSRYIIDALIKTTISRDMLLLSCVDKPAVLRRLFQLGCT